MYHVCITYICKHIWHGSFTHMWTTHSHMCEGLFHICGVPHHIYVYITYILAHVTWVIHTCVHDSCTHVWMTYSHVWMTYSHVWMTYLHANDLFTCKWPIHTCDVPQYIYIYISHICMCPFLCIHISYIYISTDDMAHSHMCERLIHTCANESFTHVACLVRIRIYDTNRLPGVVVLCDITYSCMWHASFTM